VDILIAMQKNGLPSWRSGLAGQENAPNERPPTVRFRKAELRHRVNGNLALRFEARGLTSFAGLELIRRYVVDIGLASRLRRHLGGRGLDGDYGFVSMILTVLGLMMTGGRRLRHLLFHGHDPMMLRFCGLKRLPTPRTMGRWLRKFTQKHVEQLLRLNQELVAETIRTAGLRRLTIDVDGSVVSTGLKVQWAQRGYNPHHRKVPSYFPITAFEAQTSQILRVKNRPGNIHDGKGALGFLRHLFEQIRESLGQGYPLEFRMDGAFFRQDVLNLLEAHGAEYAIKVPFYCWVGLKELIQQRRRWKRVAPGVHSFSRQLFLEPWNREVRVAIYRKKVWHRTRKNYQLDLFDPSDGHFEYSAVVTNKSLNGKNLWLFMNGRGSHEKAYGELKSGFAFDCVPTSHYGANSAWQVLSILAFNLIKSFQIATGRPKRGRTAKRRTRFLLETIQTLRYQWINRAGTLVTPQGCATLDVGRTPEVKNRFTQLAEGLQKAA
jgi:hypothetical protein